MILTSGKAFEYYKRDLMGKVSSMMAQIRHDIGNDAYSRFFLSPGGDLYNPIDYSSPASYPCLIETAISLQQSYQLRGFPNVIFKPTYPHVIITRNHAKRIVYPKARKSGIFQIDVVQSLEGLTEFIDHFMGLGRNMRLTNANEVKAKANAGIFKFPALITYRAYHESVIYDEAADVCSLGDPDYMFMVFDYAVAKTMLYYNKQFRSFKGVIHGDAKKSPKAGFFELSYKYSDPGRLRSLWGENS